MTNKPSFLIRHANFNGGNLVMVGYADSFGPEYISFFGTRNKHDAVADTKGELSLMIHKSSYSQVC